MLKLDPIKDDAISVYDAIVGTKKPIERRRRLQGLRRRINNAYKKYDVAKPALEQIKAHAFKRHKEDLLQCYKGSTIRRDRLYADVKSLAFWCAYCTAYTVSTLDHYLPKDPYPEFCVLPINLIPCCSGSGCNKSRDFKDQAGARALVHPYFDPIPAKARLLVAKVYVKRGLPEAAFSVNIPSRKGRAFAELYARHFELLSLEEHYSRAAVDALSEMARVIRTWSSGLKREDVRTKLEAQATADEQALGANHFKAALARGAADSEEFLDHCLGGNP